MKLPASFKFNGQPLRTGPDNGFNAIVNAKQSDDASALAMSPDGQWVFIWSDSGDGWVHHTTVNVNGDTAQLPVWPNPMVGYMYKPSAEITRPTDLKNGPAAAFETMYCIPAGTDTKVLAKSEDGFWLFIWSDIGDGWVPLSAVNTTANLDYLPTWSNAFEGANYLPKATAANNQAQDLRSGAAWGFNAVAKVQADDEVRLLACNAEGDWFFIWGKQGDGWAHRDQIATDADAQFMPVWTNAMDGADYAG